MSVGASAKAGSSTDPARPAFVGRSDELGRLRALVARLAAGHGNAVLIEGEAGIGKSRLVDEVAADAVRLGVEPFRATAEQLDACRPFGAIAECLGLAPGSPDSASARLADLVFGDLLSSPAGGASDAVAGAGDGRARELWLVDAMVQVVEDGCARGPVLVALDDLQWADTETLLVLHRLCRLVGDLPLLVVGTCRPAPRSAALDRLSETMAGRGDRPMPLGPLPAAEVEHLLAAVLPTAPGPRLSRLVAGAAGNPFFVLELVRALEASGALRVGSAVTEVDAEAAPPGLAVAVLHWLSFLPEEVLATVRMASVLGSRLLVQDLATALGRTVVSLVPNLRRARQSGVLTDDGDRIAFRHDLIREALYEDIPEAVRKGLHRDIALALAAAGAPAVQVAEHFVRAARVGDPVAAAWVLRAAEEVTVRSPNAACDLLARAIDLFEPGDQRRDAVIADWVVSLDGAGRGREAVEPCLELLSRPQPPGLEARMRLLLARLYGGTGRLDAALEQARRAIDLPGLSDAQRARATGWSANIWLSVPDLDTSEDLASLSLALASAAGDRVGCAVAAAVRLIVAVRRGRYLSALDEAPAGLVAEDTQPSERMALGIAHGNQVVALNKAVALMRLDRLEEAASLLHATRDEVERRGFRRFLGSVFQVIAVYGFERGDWDGAVVAYQSLVEIIEEGGVFEPLFEPTCLPGAAGIRAMVAVHRGDPATARQLVDRHSDIPWVIGRWPDRAAALLAEADDQPDAAWDRLSKVWDHSIRAGTASDFPLLGPDLVRLAVACDSRTALVKAAEVTEAVEAVAAANPGVASILGAARRCRGLVTADPALLIEARDHFARARCVLGAATAAEEAAVLLARRDPAAARALFVEAIDGYEDLDAAWDGGRVIARMREAGLRRGGRTPGLRQVSGWEALTPAERSVVELVAQGLSNPAVAERLFLSRATVKTHVSNALTKLALSSRVELAREVARRQAVP